MKIFTMMNILVLALVLLISVPVSGLNLNLMDKVGIPDPILDQLGGLMYAAKVKTCRLCDRQEDLGRVKAVWDKLVAAAPQTPVFKKAKAKKWKWELALVEEITVVDAEALPGGKIIVYTGASALAGKDPSQIAFLLGHEMAHALGRHAKSRIDKHTKTAIMSAVAGGTIDATKLDPKVTLAAMAAMGVAYEGAVVTPFARSLESEADHNALLLMAQAGYDPQAGVSYLKALGEKEPKGKSSFLADHPPVEERIANIEKEMAQATAIYRKARG
jgi:predicted Zn-dependent protease